jgi:hypothetical protein
MASQQRLASFGSGKTMALYGTAHGILWEAKTGNRNANTYF